ncbi:hypothetical protein R7D97_25155 [Vibrio sp. Vb5031]|uniref:hypothetical protein n=1 Tax=Vibrio TaxID=662 RepID=UPI0018699458|nr:MULTISPECIES: hypothetical protein [Vibrio]MBY7933480.1 hypothetical protein [Vibrio fluvialis]EJV5951107.1 hypothetical protein [Vibrio alginolyticus]ELA7323146.1 hypothetical protein [Vibrio parahaemolyticus]MBE3958844.1 hypothetical protein [Vibrio parahaemolyticus]MBO0165048.1 hypothetical protein [Vibrio alginolyticus]
MALEAPKKPKQKPNPKGTPPTVSTAPNGQENSQKAATAPLNFKTDKEFVKEWKVYCVTNDISQIDQFKRMFEFWKEHHG